MRYKKILFVIPPMLDHPPLYPWVGVGYLSSYLRQQGIENNIIDLNLGYSKKDLLKQIDLFRPDIVGISAMSCSYHLSYEIIDLIKEKGLAVVVGGPHASTFKEDILRRSKADYVILNEGEYRLSDLMSGKNINDIDGIIYREDKRIITNPAVSFVDIDKVPFPDYAEFELDKYIGGCIGISTSRGCPYSCIFCSVGTTGHKKLRMRSVETILEEIKFWYSKEKHRLEILDDNFTFDRDRVLKICQAVNEEKLKFLILNCPNGVRADRVDEEVLSAMRRAHFNTIAFGVESGNERILKNLKKGETLNKIEEAIAAACQAGFNVILFFLIGSPGETLKEMEDSFKLALKYPVQEVTFYNLIPYPQTELYDWVNSNNYFLADVHDYLKSTSSLLPKPVFQTPEFTRDQRVAVLKKAFRVRKKVRLRSLKKRISKMGLIGIFINSTGLPLLLSSDAIQKYYSRHGRYLRQFYNIFLSMETKQR